MNLGMHHWVIEYYQVCLNDDPGLTLTYFTARSNLVPYAFEWGKVKTMDFSETIVVYDLKLAPDDRSDKTFLLTSKLCPLGIECPLPWGYIHVLNHEKKKNNNRKKTKQKTTNKQKKKTQMYKIRLQRDFFETCNKLVK